MLSMIDQSGVNVETATHTGATEVWGPGSAVRAGNATVAHYRKSI